LAVSIRTWARSDLTAIENLPYRAGDDFRKTGIYLIKLSAGELMPLPAGASNGGVHLAINRGLEHDQIFATKMLAVQFVSSAIYTPFVKDPRRLGAHAYIQAAAHGLAFGYPCCRNRLKRLPRRVEVAGYEASFL
jgi:hypothetical protein